MGSRQDKLKVKVRKEEVVNYVQTERGSFLLSPQLQKRCYQMEFQGKLKTSVESKIYSLTVLNLEANPELVIKK